MKRLRAFWCQTLSDIYVSNETCQYYWMSNTLRYLWRNENCQYNLMSNTWWYLCRHVSVKFDVKHSVIICKQGNVIIQFANIHWYLRKQGNVSVQSDVRYLVMIMKAVKRVSTNWSQTLSYTCSVGEETYLNSLLVRAPDSWSKGCQFESRQERREVFFPRVNFVCWLLFIVRSTPVSPQWHVKDPGHSVKSAVAGSILTLIHTWPNEVGVGWLCRRPCVVLEPVRKRAHT